MQEPQETWFWFLGQEDPVEKEVVLVPGSGGSCGEGSGSPLQYSCLKNPMDRGAWWATVHRVTKSWTRLDLVHTHRIAPEADNALTRGLLLVGSLKLDLNFETGKQTNSL